MSKIEPTTFKSDPKNASKGEKEPYLPYLKLWNKKNQALFSAREVLDDYSKGSSSGSGFFSGKASPKHHKEEVADIVQKIDEGQIKSALELMEELNRIKPENKNDSFEKRRQFIEDCFINGRYLPPTYKSTEEPLPPQNKK